MVNLMAPLLWGHVQETLIQIFFANVFQKNYPNDSGFQHQRHQPSPPRCNSLLISSIPPSLALVLDRFGDFYIILPQNLKWVCSRMVAPRIHKDVSLIGRETSRSFGRTQGIQPKVSKSCVFFLPLVLVKSFFAVSTQL